MIKFIVLIFFVSIHIAFAFVSYTEEQPSFFVKVESTNTVALGDPMCHTIFISNKTSTVISPSLRYGISPITYNGIYYDTVTNFHEVLKLQPHAVYENKIRILATDYLTPTNYTGLFEFSAFVEKNDESWILSQAISMCLPDNVVTFSTPLPLKVGQSSVATIEFKNPLSIPLNDVRLEAIFANDFALTNGTRKAFVTTELLDASQRLILEIPVAIIGFRSGQITVTLEKGNTVLSWDIKDFKIEE